MFNSQSFNYQCSDANFSAWQNRGRSGVAGDGSGGGWYQGASGAGIAN